MNIRKFLIRSLGGYTAKEYNSLKYERDRLEQKYQALLDSKTDANCAYIANQYIARLLHDLRLYVKYILYGKDIQIWVDKVWNVINNNYLKICTRYMKTNSSIPYKLDTTLDKYNQFKEVILGDNDEETLKFILENDND